MQTKLLSLMLTLLLIATNAYAQTCPDVCTSCTVSALQVLTLKCTSAGLITLPYQVTNYQITQVVASNGGLTGLPTNLCAYYVYINTLDLSSNSIGPSLSSSSLQCLQNLQTLNLAKNQILSIDQNTFTNLPSLVILDLSYNQISSIPIYLFVWPDFTTRRLKNLKYLYLQNNKIVTLDPWFFYLQSIITINLANNQISSFTNNLNFYLQNGVINPQLKVIDNFDLSNNQISAFDDHILCRSFIKIKTQKRKKKI